MMLQSLKRAGEMIREDPWYYVRGMLGLGLFLGCAWVAYVGGVQVMEPMIIEWRN